MTNRELAKPYTVAEAAEALGVSERHVRRLIDSGELLAMNQGRRDGAVIWRVAVDVVAAFLARHQTE